MDSLLDELNELLTRCLVHRRLKQELEEKALTYWLSHSRDLTLVSTRRQLIEAESMLDKRTSDLEVSTLGEALASIESSEKRRRESADSRLPNSEMAKERVSKTALVTAYLATTSPDVVQPLSEQLERNRLAMEFMGADSDLHSTHAELVRVRGSKDGAELRSSFLAERSRLRLEENRHELDAIERRRIAATTRGSALNFADRIEEVQRMFDADFSAALIRGSALAKGMNDVFGANVPFPEIGDDGALSVVVAWTRAVSELQQQLFERAVSSGLALSLKKRLVAADWEQLIAGNAVSVEVHATEAFERARWCLVRGVRVEIRGDIAESALTFCLDLPSTPYEPKEVSVCTCDVMPNDSQGISGRINSRSLQNRSPYGRWNFRLLAASADAVIRDVVIRVDVAVVP